MSPLARFLVDTVERVRPVWTIDRYGNSVPDYDAGDRLELAGWLTTTSTTETTGGRQAITTQTELTLAAGADIDLADRIEADGRVYRIMGDIEHAKRPTGEHHLVVRLERVEG